MRIGIDCRLGGPAHAGIGRYITQLVQELVAQATPIEWVFFCSTTAQAASFFPQGLPQHVTIVLAPIKHYSVREQTHLPKIFTEARLDLLHVPHFNVPLAYSGTLVVTIHDLLWHEYRGSHVTTLSAWTYWCKYLMYRLVTHQAVTRAQRIFVPTQTVKRTLTRYYPGAEKKTVVTREGFSEAFTRHTSHSQPNLKKLLYVGSLYPHKNITLVLQALEQLPEYQLEIVGSRSVFAEAVAHEVAERGLSQRVAFLGFLSDEALALRYAQSAALVQPSLSEGFGLTGIEAMAAGTLVVASDIPTFREVYQDAAVYFDPHSVESFISALSALEKSTRSEQLARGRTVVQNYSWKKMAHTTLAEYLAVLGPHP